MDKRSEEVLSSLIGSFIDSGRPIGSKTLAGALRQSFSSATIRNVMARLEDMGLLTHKHTSGGRIPTDKGMRYYVDRLLNIEPLSDERVDDIKKKYSDVSYNLASIFKRTSKVLSGLSNYVGVVVAPKMSEMVVKQMEFISLSKDKILGIFVGRDGSVENRIIKVDEQIKHSDIEKINNYCSRAFYGLTLAQAKAKTIKEMRETQQEYDRLIKRALLLSQDMLSDIESSELIIDGSFQLLSEPDFSDLERAGSILDVFSEKKALVDFLNRTIEGERVNIFIGSESGHAAISDCSVIATPYKKENRVLGTLGIIGPTRMDYSKVVPIVDCTAKLVSNFLDGEDLYDG
jgi:heat-inducible transcriptional repressor